jgi:hypothetical protein
MKGGPTMSTSGDELFNPALVIAALIDQGYNNAPYALAELIDNSIQADATEVHIYCFSEMVQLQQKRSERISKIAVLDNGKGMSKDDLTKALQFGNGSRLGANQGLGKFGMGLPAASISQCEITEVFSWQNGVDSALNTTLSLPAVKGGDGRVPAPKNNKLDNDVEKFAKDHLQRHGTLIVWKDVIRLTPVRYQALSTNLEQLIGRMYRKQLHSQKISIYVHDVFEGSERGTKSVIPNDPLYLMAPTTTPAPYSNKPLFKEFDNFPEPIRTISFFDDTAGSMKSGTVKVKISHIENGVRAKYKEETNQDAGKSLWGTHAKKNVGYSICREGRELYLDSNFAKPSDPTERWWGVEIDFEPSLDRLFRVPTNKQNALAVRDFHHFNWKDEAHEGESEAAFYDRCESEGDPRAKLMKLFNDIESSLNTVRGLLSRDNANTRSQNKQPVRDTTEMVATKHAEEREADGFKGTAFEEPLPDAAEIVKAAEAAGVLQPGVDHTVRVLEQKARFAFETGENRESDSFFIVRYVKGLVMLTINSAHPFYDQVWKPLFETEIVKDDEKALEDRLSSVQEAFKMTLIAWSRLEDEAKGDAEKMRSLRGDWGRMMKKFLTPIVYPARSSDEPPADALIHDIPRD